MVSTCVEIHDMYACKEHKLSIIITHLLSCRIKLLILGHLHYKAVLKTALEAFVYKFQLWLTSITSTVYPYVKVVIKKEVTTKP